jgi:4-azaleucine resistance transporter AzlC
MNKLKTLKEVFKAGYPVVLGYIAIGIPCGILSQSIGLNALQVYIFSVILYSGAGQFMIPNMFLAGSTLPAIAASVSLVNTRQMLYSASFASEVKSAPPASKLLSFFFTATVTDETYGISVQKFREGNWSQGKALALNIMSETSWALSCVVGVFIGSAIQIPLSIASFAMTSIFICLLFTQKLSTPNIAAAVFAMVGVYLCKLVGLSGASILVGAIAGVVLALLISPHLPQIKNRSDVDIEEGDEE